MAKREQQIDRVRDKKREREKKRKKEKKTREVEGGNIHNLL